MSPVFRLLHADKRYSVKDARKDNQSQRQGPVPRSHFGIPWSYLIL